MFASAKVWDFWETAKELRKNLQKNLHLLGKTANFVRNYSINKTTYKGADMASEKTRQKLIDVARQLFAKNGLEETTMNDIASVSGKGRRTLYTYFKSKEAIYHAVVQDELERMSEQMTRVAQQDMDPEDKIVALIYSHLNAIKEVVQRNGNMRAEFFRDIWRVSLMRKNFDRNEKNLLTQVITEGVESGHFEADDIPLMVDIIRYAVKGQEVPYIYGRLADGMPKGMSRAVVQKIIHRSLSKK